MKYSIIDLPEIAVTGIEGLCTAGSNIVSVLWQQANARFSEIAGIALRREDGSFAGFWGAMSDEGRRFLPWEDGFTRGLYLAGAEVSAGSEVPDGWTKWVLPARKYMVFDVQPDTYQAVFAEVTGKIIAEEGYRLSGAVCDFTEPATGQNKLFFPVEKL